MEKTKIDLQEVYNASYNYALGVEFKDKYIKSEIPYDFNWMYSDNDNLRQALRYGISDGELARKKYKNDVNAKKEEVYNIEKVDKKLSNEELEAIEEICVIKEEKASEKLKKQKKTMKVAVAAFLLTLGIGNKITDKSVFDLDGINNLKQELQHDFQLDMLEGRSK